MPGGGKTLYRSSYCEVVKDFHTLFAFARHVGVAIRTVYLWIGKHPEFAEAVKAMTRSATRYRAEYCDDVVACLKDGHSLIAFAGKIDVTAKTLYNWMAEQPEFADAVKRAQAKSALWWEGRLLELAQNNNAKAIIFGLKNRASDHWRDSRHTEMSGQLERVHRIERVIVRPERGEG